MNAEKSSLTPTVKRSVVALALLGGLSVWIGWQRCATATPPEQAPPTGASTAASPALEGSLDAGVADDASARREEQRTTAEIVFTTVPPARGTVTWGRKRLGHFMPGKPLVVKRPRDTGPLDVIVRAEGFLPVHTRAYTFSDSKMVVKLTRPDERNILLGYRVPLDAGVPPLDEEGAVIEEAPSTFSPPAPVFFP